MISRRAAGQGVEREFPGRRNGRVAFLRYRLVCPAREGRGNSTSAYFCRHDFANAAIRLGPRAAPKTSVCSEDAPPGYGAACMMRPTITPSASTPARTPPSWPGRTSLLRIILQAQSQRRVGLISEECVQGLERSVRFFLSGFLVFDEAVFLLNVRRIDVLVQLLERIR